MSVILREGKRRCDAVCHLAVGSNCTCICAGKYHGSANTNPAELHAVITNAEVIKGLDDLTNQPRLPWDVETDPPDPPAGVPGPEPYGVGLV